MSGPVIIAIWVIIGLMTVLVSVIAVVAAKVLWAREHLRRLLERNSCRQGHCLDLRGGRIGVTATGVPLRVVASRPF